MSGAKHTPGPWSSQGIYVISDVARVCRVHYGDVTFDEAQANARRIVACCNALVAFTTEDIERNAVDLVALATQRSELLEALQAIMAASAKATEGASVPRWAGFENGNGEECGTQLDDALNFARAAIAKATRSAT